MGPDHLYFLFFQAESLSGEILKPKSVFAEQHYRLTGLKPASVTYNRCCADKIKKREQATINEKEAGKCNPSGITFGYERQLGGSIRRAVSNYREPRITDLIQK